jgi:aryl-alcohol dehydrogenase-like predicted oxidoreductase
MLGDPVGALGLGCMGMSEFYGHRDDVRSIRTIHAALEGGVNLLDTADMYGAGHNEELLGRALRGHREQAFVASKFAIRRENGQRWNDSSPGYARTACEASLRRLGVETIDLYYVHRLDGSTPIEDTMAGLVDLVDAGKIRYIGLSEVDADVLRRAHEVHPITAVQSEYSLWTRDVVTDGVLAAARELGTALVAYSPLGRGFLTGTVRDVETLDEQDFRRANPRFTGDNFDANLQLLEELTAIAAKRDVTRGQVALAWVLAQGGDVIPIPGTKRIEYLRQNLAAGAITLDADELARLDETFAPNNVWGQRYPTAGLPITSDRQEPNRLTSPTTKP